MRRKRTTTIARKPRAMSYVSGGMRDAFARDHGIRSGVDVKTVLVVDDNSDARAIAGFALERAGYQVVEAEDGSHALRVVEALRESLSLILLDLRMPIMDGWGFLAAAKHEPALADVPVVVLTADGRTDDVPGARQVLMKPCDPDHLVEVVAALV